MPRYDDMTYWDDRYADDDPDTGAPFDWLLGYIASKKTLDAALLENGTKKRGDVDILVIGCGNAPLSPDMYADGWTKMINVDLSTVVIRKQQAQFPEQDWRVMDVLHLEEEWTNRFDAVIDKSMVDTLLCGHADSNGNVLRMFREALRVLRPGGTFVCWSLHKMHEVKVHAAKLGVSLPAPIEGAAPKKKKKVKKVDKRSGQWGYALCRVPNPRFSQEPASNRSVSHTLMLARKCTTATATTTTTTIGSGAAESGQLVELDVAASEAAALSLPSLVDPIPKRFLRWEDGIDDEDEDEKGKECASPIAMSPEEIDRCEAIKEGLRLQEAAEECSVDKLRAILGKCLVYESIKRGYNKGLGYGVDGINNWLVDGMLTEYKELKEINNKLNNNSDIYYDDGTAADDGLETEETWEKEMLGKGAEDVANMSYAEMLRISRSGTVGGAYDDDDDDDDGKEQEEEEEGGGGGEGGGEIPESQAILQEKPEGGYDLDDLAAYEEEEEDDGNEDDGDDGVPSKVPSEAPLLFRGNRQALAAVAAKQEAFLIDALRRLKKS